MGDYSIDVLDAAVAKAGDKLLNIYHQLFEISCKFMEVDISYLISIPAILHDSIVTPEQNPTMVFIKHVSYHCTCLLIESCGSMWWLDSRRNEPVRVSPLYLHTILKKEFSKSTTSAALFILESHDVVHPVFFSGPLSFEFPPQTKTNFVCFLDIFHIFLSPQKQFPPKNYISRKNTGYTPHSKFSCILQVIAFAF